MKRVFISADFVKINSDWVAGNILTQICRLMNTSKSWRRWSLAGTEGSLHNYPILLMLNLYVHLFYKLNSINRKITYLQINKVDRIWHYMKLQRNWKETVDNLSRVCRPMFLRDKGALTAAQDWERGKKKNNRQQRHIFQIYLAE